jgi:hypothetical protein
MEWVLQVVDEFDDAFGVLRHGWLGFNAEIGASFAALLKIRGSGATSRAPLWNDGRRAP